MEATQVKQLKINVTNISSFLKNSNNTYIGLKKKNSALISRQEKRRKQEMEEKQLEKREEPKQDYGCLLYTSPSPRDKRQSRMPSSA